MTRRLLAVHAHPDDESITMGGTLARYAASGTEVLVVTATLGEEGEIIPADLAGLAADRSDQLGGYRLTELRGACAVLGVGSELLGGIGCYRDSGMAGMPSAQHPRAFIHAQVGGRRHRDAVSQLAAAIARLRPQVVLTYAADGGYGHPDHIAAHQITMAAATQQRVPRVLATVRPRSALAAALSGLSAPAGLVPGTLDDLGYLTPDEQVAVGVDVSWWGSTRRRAMAEHRTQLVTFDGGFALSNAIAQPLLDTEYFALLAGPPLPDAADDLFAGLD